MVGRTGAAVLAALAHAGYKTALFVWPPEALACDLATIAVYTAGGGILIGALREISRSVIPSIFAHVVFDLRMHLPQGLGWRGFRRTRLRSPRKVMLDTDTKRRIDTARDIFTLWGD